MKTKILLFAAIFFCATITTNAQITEGRYLLGGSFSLYNASNQNSNSVYTDIQFGKVIKENTVVGILGSIVSNNYSGTSGSKIQQYSAGVFYRKYVPLRNNFYFFGEADGSYRYSKNIQTYFTDVSQSLNTKSNGVAINFIPGISYSVWKRMQMELTMPNLVNISYQKIKTIDSSLPPNIAAQKANIFSANMNLNSSLLNNLGIGFKFLLGK